MKIQTLGFLALAAAGSAACTRTALDNPGSSSCGDQVLEGYLVSGFACLNSADPSLPGYQSTQGSACYLDVYLSDQVPAHFPPEACSAGRLTSECLLDSAGFAESLSNGPVRYPRVLLVGSMQTVEVCTPVEKCTSPSCSSCQPSPIFVPCQVTSLDHKAEGARDGAIL